MALEHQRTFDDGWGDASVSQELVLDRSRVSLDTVPLIAPPGISPLAVVAGFALVAATFIILFTIYGAVLEYSGAFLQLYREEGWYLERTVHYVNRVGLDYVKKKILDDAALRKALWERLQFSLDGEPDPWFEFDKAGVDTRQFNPVGAL